MFSVQRDVLHHCGQNITELLKKGKKKHYNKVLETIS